MIVVTGAMGFIGSNLVSRLNQSGRNDLIVVDDFYKWKKEKNLEGKRVQEWIHRDLFLPYFEKIAGQVDAVFHLGARTDTISDDKKIFDELNVEFSKAVWNICSNKNIPLIYASSAATYGSGENGFNDDHEQVKNLKPLNAYAHSKQQVDEWVLSNSNAPDQWYGLKFFNVYGPNESHKGRMASVIFHAFNQIRETGKLRLFKSTDPQFPDGGQKRDFIYVRDVVDMMMNILEKPPASGIYNVGTGKARTFIDVAGSCFDAMGLSVDIEFFDMPDDLENKYQNFTEANMSKWESTGLQLPATSLEEGINDYIRQFLVQGKTF